MEMGFVDTAADVSLRHRIVADLHNPSLLYSKAAACKLWKQKRNL
jgi:hypothetical protein